MRCVSTWALFALLSVLIVRGFGQELDLMDALDDGPSTPKPKPKPEEPAGGAGKPAGGAGKGGELSLSDYFDLKPTQKPPVKPKDPVKPTPKSKPKPEDSLADFFGHTVRPALLPRSTSRPRTSAPPRKAASDDFDLSDALDPKNDIGGKGKGDNGVSGGGNKPKGGSSGGSFSDSDLLGVAEDDTYKPDKGKGGRGNAGGNVDPAGDTDYNEMPETGTIAGIGSAVVMALVGAVTSYIAFQKKKFCFSIQQSLNADMVKAENPEAVVAQEPQVQQTLLKPPNAEPPTEDNIV